MGVDLVSIVKKNLPPSSHITNTDFYLRTPNSFKIGVKSDTADCTPLFLTRLKSDLNEPDYLKNLHISFAYELERDGIDVAFQRGVFQDFLSQKPSEDEFNNAFKTFFRDFPMKVLFQSFVSYISPLNASEQEDASVYLICLLNQDFTRNFRYQPFDTDDVIASVRINNSCAFSSNDNYQKIKTSVFKFLEKHLSYSMASRDVPDGQSEDERLGEQMDIEYPLYKNLKEYIRKEDFEDFSVFWPNTCIKEHNNNAAFVPVSLFGTYQFNYDYFARNFPNIRATIEADGIVSSLYFFAKVHLADQLSFSPIKNNLGLPRFSVEFHKDINSDNFPGLLNFMLTSIGNKDNADLSLKVKKYIECINMEKILPERKTTSSLKKI